MMLIQLIDFHENIKIYIDILLCLQKNSGQAGVRSARPVRTPMLITLVALLKTKYLMRFVKQECTQ
jgi:hypothetical protein